MNPIVNHPDIDAWESACFAFQDGRISENEFRLRLRELGYDDFDIQIQLAHLKEPNE